jgi:uncharacterized membrane protein
MIAALIDTGALAKVAYASLLAGIGIAIVFSLAIYGATRSSDMRREERRGVASAYVALAIAGGVLSTAIVGYGLYLVAHKS